MKLSQNLLGLAGLAVADYACCPYDDYGIVDGNCGLTEKTPFNIPAPTANPGDPVDDWNNNMCKAWESNVDATYDGQDGGCEAENWGGCGFQRHFAWGRPTAMDAEHSKIVMDNDNTKVAEGTEVAGDIDADIERVFGAGDSQFSVGGVPFLGGICKLFIPVAAQYITQVTIAGVHVSPQAQFPAKVISNEGDVSDETITVGTAYCFSVVNIAEFKTNTNGVGNGNVAGSASQLLDGTGAAYTGADDIFSGALSLQRQAGRDIGDFGDVAQAAGTVNQDQMVEGGANFDVVAHFSYIKCQSVWSTVDMQLAGDDHNGDVNGDSAIDVNDIDYPLNPLSGFSHAHRDLMDKRHNTLPIAKGYANAYTNQDSTYLTGNLRWPNFGAWAGYNSFVACANNNVGGGGAVAPDAHWLHQGNARLAVMSVGSGEFRSKNPDVACTSAWAEYQFNIRQIGSAVTVCGPGELPDTDNKRCTWNWNYSPDANYGASSATDPEGFFDRNENMDFAVWSRKRRAAVNRNTQQADGQPVNAAAVLSAPEFAITFKNYKNKAVSGVTLTEQSFETSATNGFSISGTTVTVNCNNDYSAGGNNQRDNFPSCFTGDEIHLKASYDADTGTDAERAFISPWLSSVVGTF